MLFSMKNPCISDPHSLCADLHGLCWRCVRLLGYLCDDDDEVEGCQHVVLQLLLQALTLLLQKERFGNAQCHS